MRYTVQQAFVDQRTDCMQYFDRPLYRHGTNGLRRFKRKPANEYSQPSEHRLLRVILQVKAPVDCAAQRLLPRRSVTWPIDEQVEPVIKPSEERLRRQEL